MRDDVILKKVLAIKDNFNQPKGYVLLTELIDDLKLDIAKDKTSKVKPATALKNYLKNPEYQNLDKVFCTEINGDTKYIASNGFSLIVLNDPLGATLFDEAIGEYPNLDIYIGQIHEPHCFTVEVPSYSALVANMKANPERVAGKTPYIDLNLSVTKGFKKPKIAQDTHPNLRVNAKYLKIIYEVLGVEQLKGYADKRGVGAIYLIGDNDENAVLLPMAKNENN